jgi:putative transposase
MARRPRSQLPDGIYHVASRGSNHGTIFIDDVDRKTFLSLLGKVVAENEWTCHAFCLMTNHYHLIVETTRDRLSRGMHSLNGGYARRFNLRHDRDGHLFRSRYGVYVIEDERHLHDACAYVLANPVRAGLCPTPADWPWSGRPRKAREREPVTGTGTGTRPGASP